MATVLLLLVPGWFGSGGGGLGSWFGSKAIVETSVSVSERTLKTKSMFFQSNNVKKKQRTTPSTSLTILSIYLHSLSSSPLSLPSFRFVNVERKKERSVE